MAARIAGLSALAVAKAKDCINRAHEVPLSEGLRYEQYVCPQTLRHPCTKEQGCKIAHPPYHLELVLETYPMC